MAPQKPTSRHSYRALDQPVKRRKTRRRWLVRRIVGEELVCNERVGGPISIVKRVPVTLLLGGARRRGSTLKMFLGASGSVDSKTPSRTLRNHPAADPLRVKFSLAFSLDGTAVHCK